MVASEEKPRASARRAQSTSSRPGTSSIVLGRPTPIRTRLLLSSARGGSGLLLGDVDHPGDAEPVDAHAELVAPHLLLQRHGHTAALGQLLPVAAQGVGVVAAEADGDVVTLVALRHPGRGVGGHQGEALVGLQLGMHDLVGLGRVGLPELAEGVDPQVAAEDVPVELHRLPGVAAEGKIRVERSGHHALLCGDESWALAAYSEGPTSVTAQLNGDAFWTLSRSYQEAKMRAWPPEPSS